MIRYGLTLPQLGLFLAFAALNAVPARAQVAPKANWIWFDEGNPLREAPRETIYFRKTFEENYELQESNIHITCDDAFVLYINGKEIGRGNAWKDGKIFDVKEHLVRGKNVIAVSATNRGASAGLVAWLVRLTKPGNHYTVATDGTWKCSKEAPENWREVNFDDSKWSSPKVLSEFVRPDRWAGVTWNGKADASRFTVKEGFTIDQVAEHEVTGSIVSMTFDAKGRPVISRERGPIFTLIDEDGDGKFEKMNEYSDRVKNCQGLCAWDATTFYCIGDGPDGTGLYRLKDTDSNDVADSVELLHKFKGGMGEHGPHAVVAGPDGYLYINSGNHAWVTATPEPGSPVERHFDLGHLEKEPNARARRGQPQPAPANDELDRPVNVFGKELPLRDLLRGYEADLLPKYEDANGHAVGIKVPGGSIWRTDPDAKHWTLEAAGYRNQYDFAFNSLGELFTFDSDMEWDEFLPWYRPVAVFHSPPGSDHGWRSGSNVGPEYYVDNLPWPVATGRGSPCGVVFYNGGAFGPEYDDALFITDWSYGRIFAVRLNRDGGSFRGQAEEFITGKPLNVTDIEVAPDGSLFFSTGGRNTEGGVFRVQALRQDIRHRLPLNGPGRQAIAQMQPQSAWGRQAIRQYREQAGDAWTPTLEQIAKTPTAHVPDRMRAVSYMTQFGPEPSLNLVRELASDADAELRGLAAALLARHPAGDVRLDLIRLLDDPAPIVQRRALEGLIRTQTSAPIDKLKPLLASRDRFVRYTARLALERTNPAEWREPVASDKNPRVVITGLVALNRIGWVAADPNIAQAAFDTELRLLQANLSREDELDLLRAIELTLVNSNFRSLPRSADAIGDLLIKRFPVGELPFDREISRIAAALRVRGTIEKLLNELERIGSTDSLDQRADAIHYARCLVAIRSGIRLASHATNGVNESGSAPELWTVQQSERYLKWFDTSRDWKGGHSYAGYINNFLRDTVKQLGEKDLLLIVQHADQFPRAATRAIAPDERINDKADAAFVPALAALLSRSSDGRGESSTQVRSPVPLGDVLLALGRTGRAEAEAVLLKQYEQSSGELRDLTVRALANFPNTRNWPIFVRALDAENKETVRAAIQALTGIEQKPHGPAAFRALIQAGGRLGEPAAWDAVVLLRQWAGRHFGHKRNEWRAELAQWQRWYAETYPDAQSATLAEAAPAQHNWTYDQLLKFLEGDGRTGSVAAGRQIFEKAICAKCHRIEQVGQSIGPDLTTLSSRFKRKDILEATIYPSRVISDQYKSYLVATKDGRVITAMKAPDDGDNYVLLLSDATTIKLPKSEVDEMAEGKQSVMPDGLMNQFSLQEIADLFAFLESGKPTAPTANGQNK